MRVLRLCLVAVAGFAACRAPHVVVLPPESRSAAADAAASPRAAYLDALVSGRPPAGAWADWAAAGEEALASRLEVPLPFSEAGEFRVDGPAAVGYRLALKTGQRVVVECAPSGAPPFRLFVDLFRLGEGRPRPTAATTGAGAAGGVRLVFDVPEDAVYLLRVQPEAGRGGNYLLSERVEAPYLVPVGGVDAAAIADNFHDARENGRRQHDGIDIFAPRGTPALASVAGVVSRTATAGAGGNAIWLRDEARGLTLYYAHLDKVLVRPGQAVKAGERIGLVGSTGNAAGGPTHLHFGVYTAAGAVDPLPFVRPGVGPALGQARRVAAGGALLMTKAGLATPEAPWLPAGTLLTIEAAAEEIYRVRLADGRAGFVLARSLEVPQSGGGRRLD
jgi:murein DD-endopeptidase MepM/ murein hydrolase activator NlpD